MDIHLSVSVANKISVKLIINVILHNNYFSVNIFGLKPNKAESR